MADADDRMKWLHFTKDFLVSRSIRFLPEADAAVVSSVRCGVLFFMAFWSGPARHAFAELKRVLAELDPEGRLELVVVDVDGAEELNEVPEFRGTLVSGAGEVAWIKGGRVVSTSGYGFHPQTFAPNTQALLEM